VRSALASARPRDTRDAAALLLVGAALALTVLGPLWLLLLAPLVFGAPHLVSDVRYLILRPPGMPGGIERHVLVALGLPLVVLFGLRVLALVEGASWPAVEAALGASSVVGAIAAGSGSTGRRVVAAALALVVARLGWRAPAHVVLGLAHLHNVVAIGLWLAWSRATVSREARLAIVLVMVAGAGAIAAGTFDRVVDAALYAPSSGLDFGAFVDTLAPGLPSTPAIRVVLLYAFAQALHYVMWLVLIPRLATPRRSLREDLGALPLALVLVLVVLVPLSGCFAPVRVRSIYLSLALFHGWLELAVIAHLWTRGRLRASAA
jgi:hypothetical protein